MARSPIVYRWDDPGAPDLDAIMPTNNDKNKLFIHTVLKACLVDGYGGKAAAGWTMPHEEIAANGCRFVLKNAANSGSLLYEGGFFSGGSSNLAAATVWACLDVPTMGSPIGAWSHKTKYEDRNTGGNGCHRSGVYEAALCDAWVVIANENTVVIVSGRTNTELSLNSSETVGSYYSSLLSFGAMNSSVVGGVDAPAAGNFYIVGGAEGSYSEGGSSYYGLISALLTSIVDVVGMLKVSAHTYINYELNDYLTSSPVSAWLPVPVVFMQHGPTAPDGNSSSRLHFCIEATSFRRLMLRPRATSGLNGFLVSNGFEYGKAFSYQGGSWVAFKDYNDSVMLFSLDPAVWGA